MFNVLLERDRIYASSSVVSRAPCCHHRLWSDREFPLVHRHDHSISAGPRPNRAHCEPHCFAHLGSSTKTTGNEGDQEPPEMGKERDITYDQEFPIATPDDSPPRAIASSILLWRMWFGFGLHRGRRTALLHSMRRAGHSPPQTENRTPSLTIPSRGVTMTPPDLVVSER